MRVLSPAAAASTLVQRRGSAVSRFVFMIVFIVGTMGCASMKTMVAPPDDLEDYRAYRVAAYEGTRLARAKRYLDRHPKGAFADEVRAAFEEEEPSYYQRASATREGIRRYLADLPDGPHAVAAISALIVLGENLQDAELRDIVRRVRYEDAKLESAAVQRRAVGEAILGAIGVLLDDGVYGVPRAEASPGLRKVLNGRSGSTWGDVPAKREEDFFFLLPTRPERESRLLTLEISLVERGGVIAEASIDGSDMLVRWAEADQIVRLDPSAPEDRAEAHVHAMARLEGALERRFPANSCQDLRRERELYHRACNGWEAVVLPGKQAGEKDSIVVIGPRARNAEGKEAR
jgi:hypothetical protein